MCVRCRRGRSAFCKTLEDRPRRMSSARPYNFVHRRSISRTYRCRGSSLFPSVLLFRSWDRLAIQSIYPPVRLYQTIQTYSDSDRVPVSLASPTILLANVLRYVRYMLSAVRLLSVCLSVTLVHPTQAVELFGNFFFTIR